MLRLKRSVNGLTLSVNALKLSVNGLTLGVNALTLGVNGLTLGVNGLTLGVNALKLSVNGLTLGYEALKLSYYGIAGFMLRSLKILWSWLNVHFFLVKKTNQKRPYQAEVFLLLAKPETQS